MELDILSAPCRGATALHHTRSEAIAVPQFLSVKDNNDATEEEDGLECRALLAPATLEACCSTLLGLACLSMARAPARRS